MKKLLPLLAAGVLAGLVIAHVDAVNGSRFHRWGWWNPRLDAWRVYGLLLVAAVPFVAAQYVLERRHRTFVAIALLMLSSLLLQLTVVALHRDPQRRPGLLDPHRIPRIVQHPVTTSYFTDAVHLKKSGMPLRPWLRDYHMHLPTLGLHSREKPPGPVLYWYVFLSLFDREETSAMVGGIVLGVLATHSIPATYGLTRAILNQSGAAFCAASYVSLIPSIVLLFPTFDQVYPVFACGMIGFWLLALSRRHLGWAVACGVALAMAVFLSYALLVLGAFMALSGLLSGWRGGREGWRRLFAVSAVVLVTVASAYAALWAISGFDPLATFQSAWRNQQHWLATFAIPRPHPQTVPGDLWDFLMGSGWISLLLIAFGLIDARRTTAPETRWVVYLCLAQPLITAATGLIQAETARVWAFMQPLMAVPVGMELSRWSFGPRFYVYAALWLITAALAQNMIFLY